MQIFYCSQLNVDMEITSEGNDFHGVRRGTKHESRMTVSFEAGGKNRDGGRDQVRSRGDRESEQKTTRYSSLFNYLCLSQIISFNLSREIFLAFELFFVAFFFPVWLLVRAVRRGLSPQVPLLSIREPSLTNATAQNRQVQPRGPEEQCLGTVRSLRQLCCRHKIDARGVAAVSSGKLVVSAS
jgi:hypothetical protein